MAVDLWNSKKKYRGIQIDILKDIAKGKWKVGDEIYSHEKMTELYPNILSMQSIRRATDILVDDDILRAEPGRKLIVTEHAETVISQIRDQIYDKIEPEIARLKEFNVSENDLKEKLCQLVTKTYQTKE